VQLHIIVRRFATPRNDDEIISSAGFGHGFCGPRQPLERLGHAEHAEIVENVFPDDLDADRKAPFCRKPPLIEAAGFLRHVPTAR